MAVPKTPTPQDVLALAEAIAVPAPVCALLAQVLSPSFLAAHAQHCNALTHPGEAERAGQVLAAALQENGGDADGMGLLALYLAAACRTRALYREAGVSEAIFLDTMGCFPRFLRESQACGGGAVFDRGFWAWRHLACRLFRLGTLEFEYRLLTPQEPLPPGLAPGAPVLSVHIPSDARLAEAPLADSYRRAALFFQGPGAAFCEAGPPQAVICGTWLLSPRLQALLPPSAGIACFGRDYALYADEPGDDSFYRWLFRGKQPPAPLPQDTSLQRAVAAHLQNGGQIGSARGVKMPNPLL